MPSQRKLLFFLRHGGYVRNFDATLATLADRGHRVHVAFDVTYKANLPGLTDQIEALAAEHPQISWGETPADDEVAWRQVDEELRRALDYWRYLRPQFADTVALRDRAAGRAPRWAIRLVTLRAMRSERALDLLAAAVRFVLRGVPRSRAVRRYLNEQAPDLVVVTPLVEIGSPQPEYLRCARSLGIGTCVPVGSWDHLTTKGLLHELPDRITVWNETQRREAIELHGVPPQLVEVTGAVAYDHWFDWRPSRPRSEFCEALGLDPERPFLLYLGSSGFIAADEGSFVRRLIDGLRALPGGGLADMQVLVRPHPQNRFAPDAGVSELEQVVVYPPEGRNPTDAEARSDYFDSIRHCSAALGINTSGMIETAIIGRPVHTFLAPEYWRTQRGSLHFRYLLPESGGMLIAAATLEQLAAQLRESFAREGEAPVENRRLVEHFVRPHGVDEPATPRLVAELERLAASGRAQAGADAAPIAARAIAWALRLYRSLRPDATLRRSNLARVTRLLAFGRRLRLAALVLAGLHEEEPPPGSPPRSPAFKLALRVGLPVLIVLDRGPGRRYAIRAYKRQVRAEKEAFAASRPVAKRRVRDLELR